jgi:transcriptional regulator with GAF, ATPase, and Fis domain
LTATICGVAHRGLLLPDTKASAQDSAEHGSGLVLSPKYAQCDVREIFAGAIKVNGVEGLGTSDKAVWLHYCGGEDVLPEGLVIEALQQSGLGSFRVEDIPPSGTGMILFDRETPELCRRLRAYGSNGLHRVLAIAVTSKGLRPGTVWNVLQAGASDMLAWDQLDDPATVVASRVERWQKIEDLMHSPLVRDNLVGQSLPWISALRRIIELARFTGDSALIVGESGTGKELVARLIHTLDTRPDKGDLVIVDCTTVTPDLAGSEFFGHERGAYTSAIARRDGAFALADGGTLFLDEVGELPLTLQAELLRVVEEHTYKRVGGNTWKKTNFRLVCATNRDLAEEQAQGRFRRDFYYRIATCTCRLPSLRERRKDIPHLAQHFLRKIYPGQDSPDLDDAVRDYIVTRDYPGNVRELRKVVSRMAQRHIGSGPITPGNIAEEDRPAATALHQKDWRDDMFQLAIRRALSLGVKLREISDGAAEIAMQIAMEEEGSTLRRAAEKLGITDRALQMRRASRRKRDQSENGEESGLVNERHEAS